jgi:L-threonylcarbamoyladenylate synthase
VGIESTVLDLTARPPCVLRPGMVRLASLQAAMPARFGALITERAAEAGGALRSPGKLPRHYSPKARLKVLSWRDDTDLESQISALKHEPRTVHVIAHTIIPAGGPWRRVSVIPHDAEAFARAIYAELHHCDELGAELIVVESPPETDEWRAVADRLKRAAAV